VCLLLDIVHLILISFLANVIISLSCCGLSTCIKVLIDWLIDSFIHWLMMITCKYHYGNSTHAHYAVSENVEKYLSSQRAVRDLCSRRLHISPWYSNIKSFKQKIVISSIPCIVCLLVKLLKVTAAAACHHLWQPRGTANITKQTAHQLYAYTECTYNYIQHVVSQLQMN